MDSIRGLYQFNTAKVLEASHVIVFCARTGLDDTYMQHVMEKEEADGRLADQEFKYNIRSN